MSGRCSESGLRNELLASIGELRRELAAVGARTYPEVVVCRASGIGHRTVNSMTTHCG